MPGCGDSTETSKTYARQYVLKVDREHHDLCTVDARQKRSVEFQLTNVGKVPLTLDIAKSCGCVDVKQIPNGSLPPGQSAKLTVVIDPTQKPAGPFSEILFVRPREVPEERQLFIAGRIEGVWVKSNGFTVHTGDAALPTIEVEGFFDSKTPNTKFLEATVDFPGLEIDLKQFRLERDNSPLGFHFRWSLPLVAKLDREKILPGQHHGQIKALVNDAEQLLKFPINILP